MIYFFVFLILIIKNKKIMIKICFPDFLKMKVKACVCKFGQDWFRNNKFHTSFLYILNLPVAEERVEKRREESKIKNIYNT